MSDLAIIKKDTVDVVASKVRELQEKGEIHFPLNYSPENAMKQAWLILQETVDKEKKHALETCTKDSVANALLDMVVQGLSPVKKQGYFIVYGKKLQFQRSYFGTMAITKRLKGVKDIYAQVVYKDDEFDYVIEGATKKIVKHTQKLSNIDNDKIEGAYCTITLEDDQQFTEIMNINQIKKSWSKSKMSNNNTHKEFPEEMAKRTVINRACKLFVNTSDDSDLIIESFNRSDNNYDKVDEVREEIKDNANSEYIDIQPVSEPPSNITQSSAIEDPGF